MANVDDPSSAEIGPPSSTAGSPASGREGFAAQPFGEPPLDLALPGPSPLRPPVGPARVLYIGLLLMIGSFAVKQVLVDLSLNTYGVLIEKTKLQSKRDAEIAAIDRDLDDLDGEIEDTQADTPKPAPSASPDIPTKDPDATAEVQKRHDEKLAKLLRQREEKDKDLEDKRKEVRKKYRPLLRDAGRADTEASASAAGKVQTMVFFKLVMDVLKIIGAAMCSVSALGIAVAKNQPTSVKTYATVIGGIAFVSVAVGGILTFFG